MNSKKTYFLSDVHLGASYIADRFAHELKLVQWLNEIAYDCERLYLVGDILDYWYEYKNVVPRGYVRFFGKLAELSDKGVEIIWLIGNHDIWIYDYLPTELGIKVVDGNIETEISGKKFFISHGDGLGALSPGFRFIRSMFRNKICQKLYSGLHPGLTIPFALNWSKSSRGDREKYAEGLDLTNIMEWAKEFASTHNQIDYIVIGHYHVVLKERLNTRTEFIILGDWIDKFSYGIFDGKEFLLKKYC